MAWGGGEESTILAQAKPAFLGPGARTSEGKKKRVGERTLNFHQSPKNRSALLIEKKEKVLSVPV